MLAAGYTEREPLESVATLVSDVVDQAREHAHEPVVVSAPWAQRPQYEPQAVLVGIHLEIHGLVLARVERAQDSQLEVVHPLVRKLQPAADAAEHERRDAAEAAVGGHREHDAVAHGHLEDADPRSIRNHLDSPAVNTSGEFDVRSEPTPTGAVVVFVSGELDLASAPRLQETLAELVADTVVVDLSECTFLDSAGMGVLLASARALSDSGRSLRVAAANPHILRVLEITAVDTLIAVHPDVEAAL